MPKSLNTQCSLCSCLPASKAKQLHRCWDEQRCHNRRSFYRRKQKQQDKTIDMLAVAPPELYFAVLYLYKDTGDKPLHALGAELWQGQHPVCKLEPIHTFGLTAGKIRLYSNQVLKAFSNHCGETLHQYKEMFELSPQHCPVRPCPIYPDETWYGYSSTTCSVGSVGRGEGSPLPRESG